MLSYLINEIVFSLNILYKYWLWNEKWVGEIKEMICFMSNHGTVDGGDLKFENGEKNKIKGKLL